VKEQLNPETPIPAEGNKQPNPLSKYLDTWQTFSLDDYERVEVLNEDSKCTLALYKHA
jgi:hypothetical protein